MVDVLNGGDDGPLAGWSIVISHGRTFLGQQTKGMLSPVYELHCVMQWVQRNPHKPPELMTARQVQPVLTYPSIREIEFEASSIVIPVEKLSRAERRDLAKSMEACEQLMGQMRAQEAGIVMAPANTKLPKINLP